METSDTDNRDWQCSRSLVPCLDLLFTSGIACDVVFVVGENAERITAHKTILQSRSPVFYKMFEGLLSETGEIRVPIPDISKEVYSTFIRYLYTDDIVLTVDIVIPILSVARKYFIQHLITMCELYVKKETTPDNVCLLLEHAHIFMEESIKADCIPLISKSEDAMKSPGFMNLCAACVKSVTDSDELLVEESVVYDAVKRWAKAECNRRGLEVTDINITEVLGEILESIKKTKEKIATSNSWQCCKPLVQCLDQLFTSNLACDVIFLVGEDKDKITAHKTVLLARSPIFYAMFEGPLSEKGEITIPDISKEVFTIFLRYLYTDDIILTVESVVPVLSVARKYFVDQLVAKCESFIKDNTTPDNVCMLLENAHVFMEDGVEEECISVLSKTRASWNSANFVNLCTSCLKNITELDNVTVTENVVYESIVRWAEAECERQGREVTDANIREVLGDILYTVRFPIMDKEYFRQKVMLKNILTVDEMIAIQRYHQDPFLYPCTDFITEYRAKAAPRIVERFDAYYEYGWHTAHHKDMLEFTSTHDLLLHGIRMFGALHCEKKVDVEVYNSSDTCMYKEKHALTTGIDCDIQFSKQVQIKGNTTYRIVLHNQVSCGKFGKNGLRVIHFDEASITFSDHQLCKDCPVLDHGLISGLKLSWR